MSADPLEDRSENPPHDTRSKKAITVSLAHTSIDPSHHRLSSPKHLPGIANLSRDVRIPQKPSKSITYSWSTPDFSLHAQSPKPRDERLDKYQQMLRDFIRADVPIMAKSFRLCPHKHRCFQNAIMKGFFRTFSAAFIFKTSLRFSTKLLSGNISFDKIKAIYLDPDSLLFGLFVGIMSFTYKVILCILRRIRGKDPIYHKTIAGFICGTWIVMDDKTRRKQIALYCLVRAISDVIKLCVRKKKIPHIPHTDIAVFTVSQLLTMHALLHAPKTLDKKYYKWIKN
eukprot:298849_1